MIRAKFVRSIYYNNENGNSINTYLVEEGDDRCAKGDLITGLGYYLSNYKDIVCELEGEWKHSSYGWQYQVKNCTEILSTSKSGVVAFLSSGMIKGIGAKTAENIYQMFGENTYDVIENNYNDLVKVKGITERKAVKIHDSYIEKMYAREIIGLLGPHGFTPKMAMKVYKVYGNDSARIIKHSPYQLCKIKGFGFLTVDRMALISHVSPESPDRIKAAVLYVAESELSSGNLYTEIGDLRIKVLEVLKHPSITEGKVHNLIVDMIRGKELTLYRFEVNGEKKETIYLPYVFQAENEFAQNVIRILSAPCKITYDIDKEIEEAEKTLCLSLDEIQKKAVKTALMYNFTVVTGGPGTGKTTVLRVFDYIYRKMNKGKEILYCAPTGRAARRMSEVTGATAVTIHKACGIKGDEDLGEEEGYEGQDISADAIVIDEGSMVDIFLAKKFFQLIRSGKKVLMEGDPDQLPSVGPGLVLYDLIKSGRIPVVELTKIFRQNEDSNIYVNIKKIKKGDHHLTYGNDFQFYPADTLDTVEKIAINLYVQKVKEYGLMNVAYITPFAQRESGSISMNAKLREIINPPAPDKNEYAFKSTVFREKDLVMELKNRGEVSNGDVGVIEKISFEDDEVVIDVRYFETTIVRYTVDDLDRLTLAYAITVHKSQGSEYKSIITPLTKAHFCFLKRNMPYTAFSRGKENVSFIGSKQALAIAVSKKDTECRRTCTAHKIELYADLYGSLFKMNNESNGSEEGEYEQMRLNI